MKNIPTIKLLYDHNSTYINGGFRGDTYKKFKKHLGYLPDGSTWMIQSVAKKKEKAILEGRGTNFDNSEWDGWISSVCYNKKFCKCYTPKQGTHFPTGLLNRAIQFFKQNNIPYELQDIRADFIKGNNSLSLTPAYEARDYQIEVVDKALKSTRGIIQMATGSGKTPTFANIISKLSLFPTVVFVTSKDLLWQAKDEIEKFVLQNGQKVEVGVVGDGKKDIKDITIMTVQTAVVALGGTYKKFDDEERKQQVNDFYKNDSEVVNLIKNARVMICDEVHHWASETCQMISDVSSKCAYRFGFSATPYRDKGDDILIEGCFGRTIANINASYLIKRGFLVRPEILFVHMNNMKHSKHKTYANFYKYGIVHNELRNNWIKDMAINLQSLDRNILILCKQIKHGKILQDLIPNSYFLNGSHSNKKRTEHLKKMKENTAGITIASTIFDEGIDVKMLDALILAGSGKSSTRALQRIGRILRPYEGKKNGIVVDFYDNCKYLRDHSDRRRQIYNTEPEFIIKDAKLK